MLLQEVSEDLILARFFLPLTKVGNFLEGGFSFSVGLSTLVPGSRVKKSPSLLPTGWAIEAWSLSLRLEYSRRGFLCVGDWAFGHPFLPFLAQSKLCPKR